MTRTLARELLAKASGPDRPRDAARELHDDILASVRALVQARRGSMLAASDYGADDVRAIFHGANGAIERFRARLERSIEQHEPRLTAIELRHEPSEGLVLRFSLRARRRDDPRGRVSIYDVTLDPHGGVRVR